MRKVKFALNGSINFDNALEISYNKIYDVITYNKSDDPCEDTISILNDSGNIIKYYLRSNEDFYFIDLTAEFRDSIINDILE